MCCLGGIWPGGGLCLCLAVLVLSALFKKFKKRVGWVCGVQGDFLSPFPHSGDVKMLEAGQRGTDNPLSSPDCPL